MIEQRNVVGAHVSVAADRDVRVVAAHAAMEDGRNRTCHQKDGQKREDAEAPAAEMQKRTPPAGSVLLRARLDGRTASDAGHHRG